MRVYQRKLLPNGETNPRFRPRSNVGHVSGRRKSKFERGRFIAWDGEGITVPDGTADGKHKYIMLVNSHSETQAVNVGGLSTAECLRLLTTIGAQTRSAIHVCFGASYDVNMILTDCTVEQIERVWRGEWVVVAGAYSVNYRPRKSFSVRRIGRSKEKIVLWDVFGFFQASFVEACRKYLPAEYNETINAIASRKAERRKFVASDVSAILAYCRNECSVLVTLMETLREHLVTAGLSVQRWDGAGACAAALLKRQGTIGHKATREDTPREVLHAAQCAYAGGRTELLKYGHAPNLPIHHYDINSAYPAAMRYCPSLARGRWQRYTGGQYDHVRQRAVSTGDDFLLCHITWAFDSGAVAYPYFWRGHDTSIFYPQHGRGWYWFPEVDAAQRALDAGAIRGTMTVNECWKFEHDGCYPFGWIDDLFVQRAQWKAAGVGAEKAMKLAINSLYGKTAQHVGGSDGQPPRYHQLEWAGYITSRTRATLYTALVPAITRRKRSDKASGIMLATDAVYSVDPLDLPIGKNLGEWSYEPHDGITVVQSGVYWTYNDAKAKPFCRGFDKGSLNVASIVEAWNAKRDTYDASLTRFITMGSALASSRTFPDNWQRWRTAPRTLSLTPSGTKRTDSGKWTAKRNPAYGLLDTVPNTPAAQVVGQIESARYPLPWDDAASTRDELFTDGKLTAPLRLIEQEAYDSDL